MALITGEANNTASVRIAAVGDLMLGDSATTVGFGAYSKYHDSGTDQLLLPLRDLMKRSDICFGNLECPLATEGIGRTKRARDQMRADPSTAASLRRAGFSAIGVANNHAVQHGLSAFEQTVDALEKVGIAAIGVRGSAGWTCKPVTFDVTGNRVGMLGYCCRPRQYDDADPPYAEGSVDQVIDDVRRLRHITDYVVVSLHWGEEYVTVPSSIEVDNAHAIADAGADLILGHHPHVSRPVERYRAAIIAYSLGNAISDMVWLPQLRTGTFLECQLSPDGASAIASEIETDDEYRPRANGKIVPITDRVVPLAIDDYARAVRQTVTQQRIASYWYTIRHAFSFPPGVLTDLVWTTIGNKIRSAFPSQR